MLSNMYFAVLVIGSVMALYSFFVRDQNNYTNILLGIISGIVYILLGYESFIGIETAVGSPSFYGGATITHQYEWVGLFFILFGIIMIIHSIVVIFNEFMEIDQIRKRTY